MPFQNLYLISLLNKATKKHYEKLNLLTFAILVILVLYQAERTPVNLNFQALTPNLQQEEIGRKEFFTED